MSCFVLTLSLHTYCKWEESKIERVSEFKYLGYTFNERATDKAQVREVMRKANKVVGCV
jgi:hypothetical protein